MPQLPPRLRMFFLVSLNCHDTLLLSRTKIAGTLTQILRPETDNMRASTMQSPVP